MSHDPAEERLERETEEYERQLRADRVADHTPTPFVEQRARVAAVPMLLGGPGHGTPWHEQHFSTVKVPVMEADEPLGSAHHVYRVHKYAPGGATVALKFCSWDQLTGGQALALAWDWLLNRALPGSLPLRWEDFEREPDGEQRRRLEAIASVLSRKLPELTTLRPQEIDRWLPRLAGEILAAAETGI